MGSEGRDVWLLVLFSFPVGVSLGLRMVFFMPYLSMLGLSEAQMGLVAVASSAAMALLAVPFGLLADLRGRKPFLLASRLLIASSDLMFFFARSGLASLVLASLLGGIGASMTSASRQAFLADKTRGTWRRRAFTASSMALSIGCMAGSILAGLPELYVTLYPGVELLEATRLLFLLCALSSFTAFLLLLPVKEERPKATGRSGITIMSWRVIGSYCAFQALLGSGAGLVVPWFSYYFWRRFGVRLSSIGFLFAATQALLAAGNLSAYGLAAKLGDIRTVVLCQLVAVALLLAIPASPFFTLAAALYVAASALLYAAFQKEHERRGWFSGGSSPLQEPGLYPQ